MTDKQAEKWEVSFGSLKNIDRGLNIYVESMLQITSDESDLLEELRTMLNTCSSINSESPISVIKRIEEREKQLQEVVELISSLTQMIDEIIDELAPEKFSAELDNKIFYTLLPKAKAFLTSINK